MKVLFFISLLFSFAVYSQIDSISKQTYLTIVQGTDSIKISENVSQITLKAETFKFVFHTLNSDAVFLNCSFDSTAYFQVLSNKNDSLTCFHSPQTFSETEKNYYHQIIVVKTVNRGYHCLYAYAEDDQFVRFDSVNVNNSNDWIGVRTVEQVYVLPGVGITSLASLKGKYIYFVYSPGQEKNGKALRIYFE